MSNRITIQIVGGASDRENVRLNDLIDQLSNVKKALRENEIVVSGRDSKPLEYRIVALSQSSPAKVSVEPIAPPGMPKLQLRRVVGRLTDELRRIKKEGKLIAEPELGRLYAYQRLGLQETNHVAKIKLTYDNHEVTIDQKFKDKLNVIVGPDEYVNGDVTGMLDVVNFHNVSSFRLYPIIGPAKINGTFPVGLRSEVKEAIGNLVTVSGVLKYKTWSPYPHAIRATSFDVHEPESELPTLTMMKGAFRGSTDPMDSVQFIDSLRNEDD